MRRARKAAGFDRLRDVETVMGALVPRSSLFNFEKREAVPRIPQARYKAVLLCVLYGVDPTDFELGPDDVPPAIDLRALRKLARRKLAWFTADELRRALVAA
jgi:hypothetical protein